MSDVKRKMGWLRDLPDHRDITYRATPEVLRALPRSVDLRRKAWPIPYDQGAIGSCTGNAIAFLYEFARMHQELTPPFTPSRLFIYYNERKMIGTTEYDSGAYIRDGMKSINRVGICPESQWPYSRDFTARPSADCYETAEEYRSVRYNRLSQTLSSMRGCLAEGFPFVFGFTVYSSFDEAGATGIAPLPGPEEEMQGGHAVVAVGYRDSTQRFLCRNSWGTGWGKGGYFSIPYSYLTSDDLSADFWTLRLVTPKDV